MLEVFTGLIRTHIADKYMESVYYYSVVVAHILGLNKRHEHEKSDPQTH